jgi:hypothetical protein
MAIEMMTTQVKEAGTQLKQDPLEPRTHIIAWPLLNDILGHSGVTENPVTTCDHFIERVLTQFNGNPDARHAMSEILVDLKGLFQKGGVLVGQNLYIFDKEYDLSAVRRDLGDHSSEIAYVEMYGIDRVSYVNFRQHEGKPIIGAKNRDKVRIVGPIADYIDNVQFHNQGPWDHPVLFGERKYYPLKIEGDTSFDKITTAVFNSITKYVAYRLAKGGISVKAAKVFDFNPMKLDTLQEHSQLRVERILPAALFYFAYQEQIAAKREP